MRSFSTFSRLLFIVIFIAKVSFSYGQIITFTTDTLGAMNFIAPNATATSLSRVNGAALPTFICQYGFSSKTFNTTGSFSTSFGAIEVTVTPNSGHTLSVTGFTADLRRSNTGPVNARFAYSVDGGTTWTDQGVDDTPMHAGCDTLTTVPWAHTFTVAAPNALTFRVYGYNASGSSGTFQIENLMINGSVTPPVYTPELASDKNSISIYPNPADQNTKISYSISVANNVSISIYNLLGQVVSNVVNNEAQQPGDHSYSIVIPAQGVYFVRVTIGNESFTRRIEKL